MESRVELELYLYLYLRNIPIYLGYTLYLYLRYTPPIPFVYRVH